VDRAVSQIFSIFGQTVGVDLDGALAKNIELRIALDKLLARQESMYLDRHTYHAHQYQMDIAKAKAGWMQRRRVLERWSMEEVKKRESAEQGLAACQKRLQHAEETCHRLMEVRRAIDEVPAAPAILLGNTHLRSLPEDAKKQSDSPDSPGESGSSVVASLPIAESGHVLRAPEARLVWSQDSSSEDMGRQRSAGSEGAMIDYTENAAGTVDTDWEQARGEVEIAIAAVA